VPPGKPLGKPPAEPNWLTVETVVEFNREIVAAGGEPHELRDLAALEAAIRHAWNVWVYFMDRDFAVLAARHFTSIAAARAFTDGNKRTAYRAALAFLDANGLVIALGDNRRPVDQLLEFFSGRLSNRGVVEWFRLWMEPKPAQG